MARSPLFPFIFLLFLGATGLNQYEHTYRTGSVSLAKKQPDRKLGNAKCQLDFTITNDSLIVGRFQVIDAPSDWAVTPKGTFHGKIAYVNSPVSFGTHIARHYPPPTPGNESGFEWETSCFFDSLPWTIEISKVKGRNQFSGKLKSGAELVFHLE